MGVAVDGLHLAVVNRCIGPASEDRPCDSTHVRPGERLQAPLQKPFRRVGIFAAQLRSVIVEDDPPPPARHLDPGPLRRRPPSVVRLILHSPSPLPTAVGWKRRRFRSPPLSAIKPRSYPGSLKRTVCIFQGSAFVPFGRS